MERNKLNPELVVSEDGSHTLRIESLKENYHSHKGAIQESLYVFIEKGLEHHDAAKLTLLEVGFGTGLNAFLAAQSQKEIDYHTLEPFPLESSLISALNYPELVESDSRKPSFMSIHNATWNEGVNLGDSLQLHKYELGLEDFAESILFDVVFYDAFAPHAQPELWEPWVWEKLFGMMNNNGILVTYCAKGQVRRDMQAVGFEVERLPGPPGKREMLRATKNG